MLLNKEDRQVIWTKSLIDNKYTRSLKKIIFDFYNDSTNGFLVSPDKTLSSVERIWLLLQSPKPIKQNIVSEGDVFRFGRQVVRVSKFLINESEKHDIDKLKLISNIPLSSRGSSSIQSCRICLEPETVNNPFDRNLCLCSQNLPAHFICLVKWLRKKIEQKKVGNTTFYDSEKLICDICKTPYQSVINFQGNKINLLNAFPEPSNDGVLIELIGLNGVDIKGIYLIEWSRNSRDSITIGRTSKNTIRINDASISRTHAILCWHSNQLHVFDQDSKFGTCRMLPARVPFRELVGMPLVFDKYRLDFHVLENGKLCGCFKEGSIFTNPINNMPELVERDRDLVDQQVSIESIVHNNNGPYTDNSPNNNEMSPINNPSSGRIENSPNDNRTVQTVDRNELEYQAQDFNITPVSAHRIQENKQNANNVKIDKFNTNEFNFMNLTHSSLKFDQEDDYDFS